MVAPWLLAVWIGDPQIVKEGATPLRLILGAVAVNAVYHLIYQRILARGHGHLLVLINVVALAVVTPVAFFAAQKYGILAGGLTWMLSAIIQLGFGVLWVFKNRTPRLQQGLLNE
jgi:O-antigen/teichoic acid export membrane protein